MPSQILESDWGDNMKNSNSTKRLKDFVKAYRRNKQAMVGFYMLLFILFVAIFADFLAPYSPTALEGEPLQAPCAQFKLGTDSLGRDVLSRMIHGTRVSLAIGIIAAAISGVLGTVVGATAGFFGGKTDAVLSEIIDIVLMIPTFFLILIVVSILGSGIFNIMLVIGFTSWPGNARVMRSQALSLKNRTFVQAARAIGEPDKNIMFRYIIPNGIFPVISNTTMQIAMAILTEASLSFLGLGDPSSVSWGQMIFAGRTYITSAWWVALTPGVAIVVTVATFYMLGDGLNKVLNPKLRT